MGEDIDLDQLVGADEMELPENLEVEQQLALGQNEEQNEEDQQVGMALVPNPQNLEE